MESLIKGGYKEEIRDDYKVTEKLKRIWATELGLYKVFVDMCEKYNLRYFVAFGTLLGAVRHKGFIPWDDDFDVMMPREDYDKLCEIAPKALSEPYFFQTPYTDKECLYSFAKIRDSRTTWFSPVFKPLKMNHGIWLDIFPMDYCDFDTAEKNQQEIYDHIMACSSYMKRFCVDMLNERQLENYNKYYTNDPWTHYEEIQRIARNPQAKESGYLGISVLTVYNYSKMIWPKECFEDYKLMEFENLKVRVPQNYELVLQTIYGDFMQYPPIEKRGTWHSEMVTDPLKPFSEYVNRADLCKS